MNNHQFKTIFPSVADEEEKPQCLGLSSSSVWCCTVFSIMEFAIFSLTFRLKVFSITWIMPPPVLQLVPNLSFFIYFCQWKSRNMVGEGRIKPTAHNTLPKRLIWGPSAFLRKVWFAFSLTAKTKILRIKNFQVPKLSQPHRNLCFPRGTRLCEYFTAAFPQDKWGTSKSNFSVATLSR